MTRKIVYRLAPAGLLIALAACSRSDGNSNLGAASGNSLNEAQIDAALGPADQGRASINSTFDENVPADENATANEEGNRR